MSWQLAKRFRIFLGQMEESDDGEYMKVAEHLLAIQATEDALDWALRHGAYADDCGGFLTRETLTGKLKKIPPFPPLIPVLERARRRVCGLPSDRGTAK